MDSITYTAINDDSTRVVIAPEFHPSLLEFLFKEFSFNAEPVQILDGLQELVINAPLSQVETATDRFLASKGISVETSPS